MKKKKYAFTYFDPSNPDQDRTWQSDSAKGIKKKREDIVGQVWGSNPESVPIRKRKGSKMSGYL